MVVALLAFSLPEVSVGGCVPNHFLHYLLQGSLLTPGMDHPLSLQPASMMGPLTQQLGHLSLSSLGPVKECL